MKVLFRVDVHHRIGYGHLSRCLNLAQVLAREQHQVCFIGRGLLNRVPPKFQTFHLRQHENAQRTEDVKTWLGTTQKIDLSECLEVLPAEFRKGNFWDWIIVDHYAIDSTWESVMNFITKKLMVIDDLADRKHYCDLLLDQTPYPEKYNPYQNHKLIDEHSCLCLLGPKYVLLDSAYESIQKPQMDKGAHRILLNFGSSDFSNQTQEVLTTLSEIFSNDAKLNQQFTEINVVCGHLYKKPETILELAQELPGLNTKRFRFFYSLTAEELRQVILEVDICLGAAGVSNYERCCIGLPSILICVADNQENNAIYFSKLGATNYLGRWDQWEMSDLQEMLYQYANKKYWSQQAKRGKEIVDGKGCQRVRLALEQNQS